MHSIVAEKQLPTELLDEWTSWAGMKDEEPVHSLEIFTDGAASLSDVWPRAVRSAVRGLLVADWLGSRLGRRHVWPSGL